jgi:hypothetical protein
LVWCRARFFVRRPRARAPSLSATTRRPVPSQAHAFFTRVVDRCGNGVSYKTSTEAISSPSVFDV